MYNMAAVRLQVHLGVAELARLSPLDLSHDRWLRCWLVRLSWNLVLLSCLSMTAMLYITAVQIFAVIVPA